MSYAKILVNRDPEPGELPYQVVGPFDTLIGAIDSPPWREDDPRCNEYIVEMIDPEEEGR